jgi:chromosome segregation ATPase
MRRFLFSSVLLLSAAGVTFASQSSTPAGQSTTEAAKPAAQSPTASDQGTAESVRKKPKKVWTNEEISKVGGEGSISVVGNMSEAKASSKGTAARSTGAASGKERQVANYRNRLRQLQNQLETIEKQISDLRNFKAENTGASAGINMNRGYSMTPVEDQVKDLEEKKRQIQAQIGDVEDAARKDGIEPGELR